MIKLCSISITDGAYLAYDLPRIDGKLLAFIDCGSGLNYGAAQLVYLSCGYLYTLSLQPTQYTVLEEISSGGKTEKAPDVLKFDNMFSQPLKKLTVEF